VPCPKTGKQAENARFKPKIKELAAEKATRVGRKIKVYDYSIPPRKLNRFSFPKGNAIVHPLILASFNKG
jgi:hypothetical protein